MRASSRAIRAALIAALLAPACSLIVADSLDDVRCEAEGTIGFPACYPDRICANGRCRACEREERCGDAIDNDCNGIEDDGCGGNSDIVDNSSRIDADSGAAGSGL
jgi:hypothetical protein